MGNTQNFCFDPIPINYKATITDTHTLYIYGIDRIDDVGRSHVRKKHKLPVNKPLESPI